MAVEVIYLWRALPFCSRATKEELVQILGMALPPTALPYHQALRAWLLGGMLSSLKRTAEAERVSKGAQGFFHTGFFAGGGEFSRDNKWMHVKQIVCKLLGGGVWGYAPPPPPPRKYLENICPKIEPVLVPCRTYPRRMSPEIHDMYIVVHVHVCRGVGPGYEASTCMSIYTCSCMPPWFVEVGTITPTLTDYPTPELDCISLRHLLSCLPVFSTDTPPSSFQFKFHRIRFFQEMGHVGGGGVK